MFVFFLLLTSFNKVLKLTLSTPFETLEREQSSCKLSLAIISKFRMIGIQLQIFCVHLQLCSRSSHEFLSDETHLHNMMHLATLMALLTTTIRNEGLPLAAGWDDCSCKCHDSLFLSEQALQNPMIMDETVPLGNSDHADNNLC